MIQKICQYASLLGTNGLRLYVREKLFLEHCNMELDIPNFGKVISLNSFVLNDRGSITPDVPKYSWPGDFQINKGIGLKLEKGRVISQGVAKCLSCQNQ